MIGWVKLIPTVVVAGALVGGVGWVASVVIERNALRADLVAWKLKAEGCEARAENLTEDKESDNEVDNIPDDGLRTVPDRWLRP